MAGDMCRDPYPCLVLPGLDRAPCWRADSACGIKVRETHARACQGVDTRCFNKIVVVTTNVFPSQIINENQDDIRTLLRVENAAACEKCDQHQMKSKGTHVVFARGE